MAATPQENAALVRKFLTNVVAGGDTDAVSVFLTEDAVDHNRVFGAETEREGMTALGWRVLASGDVTIGIRDAVAADDSVAVRGTVSGRHCESLMDLAPTGGSFTVAYMWFCRIADGLISESGRYPTAWTSCNNSVHFHSCLRADHRYDRPNTSNHDTPTAEPQAVSSGEHLSELPERRYGGEQP